MKKKLWIFIISAVAVCLAGALIWIGVSKRVGSQDDLVIKEEEQISGEDETELIPEVEKDENKTDNTNESGTGKDNAESDDATISNGQQSGENKTEDNKENSTPIELPFVEYKGNE